MDESKLTEGVNTERWRTNWTVVLS